MKNLWKSSLFVLAGTLALASCDDDADAVDFTASQEVSADYNMSQSESDQIVSYSDAAIRTAGNNRVKSSDLYCAAFSHNPNTNTVTLDFGTSGCTGADGRTRKGKIIVTYTGLAEAVGSNARTITFDNYSVNGNGVAGTITVSKWALASASSFTSKVTATNLVITYAEDGATFKLNGSWDRTINIDAQAFTNSSYTISGGSTGTTREGHAFVSTITSPITFKLSCVKTKNPYAVAGVQDISVASTIPVKVKVDYGNGDCDKLVTITVNGQSKEYTLP